LVGTYLNFRKKVDEWVSGLGENMSSKETQHPNVFRFQQTDSKTESYYFSRKQANKYRPLWNQEKNETEALRRRIRKREEEEARREREHVLLTGKFKPSETYIKAVLGSTNITDTNTDTDNRYQYRYRLTYNHIGIGIGLI
jgi:hypothetical protein